MDTFELPELLFGLGARVTALLSLTVVALLALKRASAATRHLIAVAGLAGTLALPLLAGALPRWGLPVLPAITQHRGAASAVTAAAPAARGPVAPAVVKVENAPVVAAKPAVYQVSPAPLAPASTGTAARYQKMFRIVMVSWIAAGWFAVAALLLLRVGAGLVRLKRIAGAAQATVDDGWLAELSRCSERLRLRRLARLLRSQDVAVPMTSGAMEPVVILPATASTWTAERRRLVLLHELAHVKRNDWLSLLLCEIAAAFWWFNPLAWVALRAARREAEKATDDAVLRAGARPSVYATHLIDIVRSLRGADEPVGAMAMARPSDLEARLRALLDRRGRGPSSFIGRGLAVGLVGFAVMLATVEPTYAAGNDAAVEPAPVLLAKNDRKHRSSHEDHYGEGMDAHRHGRYREAIEHFQKAIDGGQREAAATYNVACGYARLGDSARAFEWLEKAVDAGFDVRSGLDSDDDLNSLREDPRFRQLKSKARSAKHGGRDNEAKRVASRFDRLQSRNPPSADPWYSVGKELLHAGDYDRAAKAFQEAATRTDKPSNSLYNTACALSLKGDARNALDALERAIDAGYDDARHMDRDDDLDNIRDEPRFRELRKMAQDLAMPKVGYGSTHRWFSKFTRGDYEQDWRDAAKRYEAFSRAHPRSGHAWYKLGYAHLALDEPEDAVTAFERALQLGYRKATTLYNLACAEARADNKDRAFQYLDQAIEAGFNGADTIRNDDDLDNLRGDPRYRAAIRKADVAGRSKDDRDEDD